MGWDILIVWFTLTNAVLGAKHDITTVWCVNDDIKSQPNLVKGIKEGEMLCKAETISNYPFSVDWTRTTPKPESIDLRYITYKTSEKKDSKQIAVHVTWTYKVEYFSQIESYHIELNYYKPPGSPLQYLMTWDRNLTLALENTSAKLVKFNFLFCGTPESYHIHPRDVYIFRIQACPTYQEIDEPQIVHKNITIPDCDNKIISQVQHCSCPEGQKKKRGICRNVIKGPPMPGTNDDFIATITTGTINPCPLTGRMELSSEKQGLNSSHTIILTIGLILIFIFSAFAIWAYRQHRLICCKRTSKQTVQKKRRVLLICTSDSEFLEPMNRLIDIFSEFGHLDLNCNLRQRNEIGDWGVHEWTKKLLHNADVVAFLVANSYGAITNKEEDESSRLDNIDHQVGLVLKATEKIIVNNKRDSSDKKFVLVDIKNSTTKENLQYFQHLRLPGDFNKFTKIILGDKTRVSAKDRSIFLHSLAIAQLGDYSKKEPEVLNDLAQLGSYSKKAPEAQNDLAQLGSYSKKAPEAQNDLVQLGSYCKKAPEAQNDLDRSSQLSLPCGDHTDLVLYPRNIGFDGPPSAESNKSVCYTADFNDDQKERFNQAVARPKASC